MSRLRTKGDSIAFRLPVHLDDILKRHAEARGLAPRDLSAEIVAEWLEKQGQAPAKSAAPEPAKTGFVDEFFR